jgi:hypothetical protein
LSLLLVSQPEKLPTASAAATTMRIVRFMLMQVRCSSEHCGYTSANYAPG